MRISKLTPIRNAYDDRKHVCCACQTDIEPETVYFDSDGVPLKSYYHERCIPEAPPVPTGEMRDGMLPGQSIRWAGKRVSYQPGAHPEKPFLAFNSGTCVAHFATKLQAKAHLAHSGAKWSDPS